jgi:hypothetical protein
METRSSASAFIYNFSQPEVWASKRDVTSRSPVYGYVYITRTRKPEPGYLNLSNRPRLDQQFGATEACRELELITGNVDAEKQCKLSCCYFLDFV